MEHVSKRSGIIVIALTILTFFAISQAPAQQDQASLLLDLKKARAAYDIARQTLESNKKLFENKAISEDEYNTSKNELLSREVDYQKLILRYMDQQSYIIVENAVKYQTPSKKRKVKVVLRSTATSNDDFLDFFKQNPDLFTPEMRMEKVYNVFVSLVNLEDQTIIGDPYEAHVPSIQLGKRREVHFTLLRDVESLQILLNYGDRSEQRNVYLQQDASANIVDVRSMQFSQEANLGGRATFDLNLERFSSGDDIYKLEVVNLPRQISYDFIDPSTQAHLSQVKFPQGETSKKLSLIVYLPDRTDSLVIIDQPMDFYALALARDEVSNFTALKENGIVSEKDLNSINAGKAKLELIPRGVGRIEIMAQTLYHEIKTGQQVEMTITVKNGGTRRLDNIRITTDNPLNWRSEIVPDIIPSLEVEKETQVKLNFIPPSDVGVGAQEVKIKTEALADNRPVQTEDKTVRIQISAKAPLLGSIILIFLLIGLVVGIVVFGIKLSRR